MQVWEQEDFPSADNLLLKHQKVYANARPLGDMSLSDHTYTIMIASPQASYVELSSVYRRLLSEALYRERLLFYHSRIFLPLLLLYLSAAEYHLVIFVWAQLIYFLIEE